MKLLIATPLYPPEIGGPATDAAALYVTLTRSGHTMEVYPFSRVRTLPRIIRHIVYGWRLFVGAREVSCIVSFDVSSVGVPAAVVAWLRRVPLVVRVPGDYAWEQATQRFGVQNSIDDFQHKRYGLVVEALRLAQRFVVQRAALVVAPSDYFKGVIALWGVKPERLTRIYLGLDLEEQFDMPQKVPSGKILFSLGRFVPWKGFMMLIDLLRELPQEWHLVIAGDGPQRAQLEARIRDEHLTQRVTLTGSVSHAQALGWYRQADAFVLNTSFESFSFQVLEALAAGVPIITTRVGSLPELVTSGVEGVLCTPNDLAAFTREVLSTSTEPEQWRARGEAAKKKSKLFSIDTSARTFAAAILTVCE